MPRIATGLVLIACFVPMAGRGLLADEPRRPLVAPPVQKPFFVSRAPDVQMEVLVDGRVLPTVQRDGKTYVVAPKLGVEYQIRLSNKGSRRVMFNVAVDGLSVLNGEAASDNGNGYVLTSRRDYLVKGWRRGDDKVAAFSFIKAEASYAALTGRPEGIGTIRLIAVEEQPPRYVAPRQPTFPGNPSPFLPNNGRPGSNNGRPGSSGSSFKPSGGRAFGSNGSSSGNSNGVLVGNGNRSFQGGQSFSSKSAQSGNSAQSSNRAGTGYGRELNDQVGRTQFTRSTNVKRITLHYVTAEDLPGETIEPVEAPPSDNVTPSDNFTPPPPGYKRQG